MKQSVMGKDLLPGTVHGSQRTVETAVAGLENR